MSPTNAVRPLTLYQSGAEGVYAQGKLHMATKPTANDTVTIGGVVYTFKASATTSGDVAIGSLVTNSQANLVAAIGGDAHNVANPFVTVAAFITNDMTVTARVVGTVGNSIATTSSLVAGAPDGFDAATLGTTRAGSVARGTQVPATSKLVSQVDFDAEDALERTPYALGFAWQNRGYENPVTRGTKITIPDYPMNFEQMPLMFPWVVTGNVKPTGVGAPVTYVYTPSNVADPAINTRTIQRRITDGSYTLDDYWAFVMLDAFTFKWQQRKNVLWGFTGFGRRRQDATFTAAQVPPSPLTQIPAALVKVFVNDAWADLGNTQITGQHVSGEFAFNNGMKPYESADGRTDLDFSDVEFDPETRMFTFKTRAYVRNSGLAVAERAKAEAGTYRAIRISMTDPTSTQSVMFDFIAKHTPASQVQKMVDVEGQEAVDLEFTQSTDDPTNPSTAHALTITVTSNTLGDA